MVLDPKTKKIEALIQTVYSESFKGVNDLHFAANGDLYFTDQGQTGMADPSGRVFRLRANGQLEKLLSNGPSPNGITYNEATKQEFVAMTRATNLAFTTHGRWSALQSRCGNSTLWRNWP
jgi:gluconolactonase